MKNGNVRRTAILTPLLVLLVAACNDALGPQTWSDVPEEFVIFSATRPELLGRPAAFDFISLSLLRVESLGTTGQWDAVLAEQAGEYVLVPASAFPGAAETRAAIAPVTAGSLADVLEAPRDTAAFRSVAVPIEVGGIYVVRTRREFCVEFGTAGVRYAKMQILAIDDVAGTVHFAVTRNPFCNTRALVPPDNS
jgi:hypothetical protein